MARFALWTGRSTQSNALKSFAEATTSGELADAHTRWLGRKSELKVGAPRTCVTERRAWRCNAVRERLEEAFADREAELERAALGRGSDERSTSRCPGDAARRRTACIR